MEEFDKKFLFKLNQIALKHLYVELYADQEQFLRSSLQKVIKADRERCLGCVPEQVKEKKAGNVYTKTTPFGNGQTISNTISDDYVNGYNFCCQQTIDAINNSK